jgi:hypothetical protein
MSLYTVLLILLIIGIVMWLIWKYVPQPPKFILLIIVGIGLVIWLLNLLGLFSWMQSAKI